MTSETIIYLYMVSSQDLSDRALDTKTIPLSPEYTVTLIMHTKFY